MFDLTGKTALITGATGGIGGAIAAALHGAGATVALSGTRVEVLTERAAELGPRVHVLPCDLAEAEAVDALVGAAEAAMGPLDILVNNAGLTRDNIGMRMKDEEWEAVLNVNLTSAFRLTRAAARSMMRRRSGRIISITSVVGVTGNPGQANYAASKAGMIGMSKSFALEIASRGVTVNCVAPGMIATQMTDALTETQRNAILSRIPMGRLGCPEDIAACVHYLASDAGKYITGQTLHVNGGLAMI
ncbi:3-oxoacyl-[acyl-carrier protein] reductase [hydrothermal vent metagenome]|uniref:3-oxoacyl-[acyl-carrier protein] reductase n=1 Tax=hydrothermal vent metagenome TaxID=652676 RepID=A0A3B0U519_9ZZZZ